MMGILPFGLLFQIISVVLLGTFIFVIVLVIKALKKYLKSSAEKNEEKSYITERILEEVRGRMLEDMILLETLNTLKKDYSVFKFQFMSGVLDMVIYDKKNNWCAIYEIKHSKEYVREQARHLLDDEKIALTTHRFGKLVGRYVLYLGENMDSEEGIAYRNAEEFLKNLPQISLDSGLEETIQ